jgi:hypothetical protein
MIRGVAAWALAKSGSPDAESMISERIGIEPTPEASDELTLASMALRETPAYETVLQADEWAATTHGVEGLALIPSQHEPIGLLAMGSNLASEDVEVRGPGWWSRLGGDQLAAMTLIRDESRVLAKLRIEARREQRAREHSMGSLARRKL